MAASKQVSRILVHLKKNNDPLRLANFSECVLNVFGHHSGVGNVYAQLKDNSLRISDSKFSPDDQPVLIKHPSFCPIVHLKQDDVKSLDDDIATRGIDVGVAVVLESCDGKVLLTRRAHHLRTFPGIWVPPGGHVEQNETLIEAGLRELKEETGLSLSQSDFVMNELKLLALWESVFPPKLCVGSPRRHHVVVYFHSKLRDGFTADELEDRIMFDPGEVGACAWLNRELITNIVDASEENLSSPKKTPVSSTFRAVVLDDKQEQCTRELPADPLFNTLPAENDGERVSTGTKFALEQFLQL